VPFLHLALQTLTVRIIHLDDDVDLRMVRTCQPPELGAAAVFNLLLRLDAIMRPGLTAREFMDLFVRCNRCGLIMTRRVFLSHDCTSANAEMEVLDLTLED
jgi:hypothetical protein